MITCPLPSVKPILLWFLVLLLFCDFEGYLVHVLVRNSNIHRLRVCIPDAEGYLAVN